MAVVEYPALPSLSQGQAERESLKRYQDQQRREVLQDRLAFIGANAGPRDLWLAELFVEHGFGHLLPDFNAPNLTRAAG